MSDKTIASFLPKTYIRGVWFAVVIIVPELLSGCSPYVYSDQIQTFGSKVTALDTGYKDTEQKILAEKHLADRNQWISEKNKLSRGPGCEDKIVSGTTPCELKIWEGKKAESEGKNEDKVPVETDQIKQLKEKAKNLTPPKKEELLKSIDNYSAALVALTKAEDRTAFDNAAGKLSTAVGSLTSSVALLSGAGAAGAPLYGTLASSSSNAVFWLIGQDLDRQRLDQLRKSTKEANDPIQTLANVIGNPILSDQRHKRLDGLGRLLSQKIQAANNKVHELCQKTFKKDPNDVQCMNNPPVADAAWSTAYGVAIDEAQATADAYEAVRKADPEEATQALIKAHDDLTKAVASNNGQFQALVASLQTFAQKVSDLEKAAAAVADNKTAATTTTSTK